MGFRMLISTPKTTPTSFDELVIAGELQTSVTEDITLTAAATTDSAANLIPANAQVVAVRSKVLTSLDGADTYDLGVALDTQLFAAAAAGAAGSLTSTFALSPPLSPFMNETARKVRITPSGGAADAGGIIRVCVTYRTMEDLG
jgi:hypothetical protein